MIFRSIRSEIFDCEFTMKTVENIGKVYQCNGKVLESGRENFIENVVGVHLPNNDKPDVKSLHLVHQNMNRFPENLHNVFSNLAVIYVANSNLMSLTAEDLKHFKDLKVLDVWNNKLQSIPADLFIYTPNIQRVSFAKNPIQLVEKGTREEGLFDGLVKLQQVDFRHTSCIDMRAKNSIEIINLKQQLVEKCSSSGGEMSLLEIKKVLFEQSATIILMAKEVIEHKDSLKTQAENVAGLVSEASSLILQVIEVVVEQGQTIEDLEDSLEDQDEVIESLEKRLKEVEKKLGMN